jgi:hypothetical protein
MSNGMKVNVSNGKYTFVREPSAAQPNVTYTRIDRGGARWCNQPLPGDNAVHSMMCELDAARVVLRAARSLGDHAPQAIRDALTHHSHLVDDREPPSAWCGEMPPGCAPDPVDWQQKCAELEEALAMATGPTCDGCGEPVDLEWCHCGEAVAAHGQHSGHSPVEMGCCCHVDDPARHRKAAGVLRSELFRARSEIAALKTEIAKLVANGAPLRAMLDEHDRLVRRGAP